MASPSFVATLLLGALISVVPLALASPPDPIWVGGVFDGGDLDDVVVAVTSSEGATSGAALPTGRVVWLMVCSVPFAASSAAADPTAPAFQGRAPPSA